MSVLDTVLERRDAAFKDYTDHLTAITAEGHELTPEEDTKLSQLRTAKDELEERVIDIDKEARRASEIEEVRERLGTVRVDVHVTSEPRTYGPGAKASYYLDLVRSSSPTIPGYQEATERLNRYATEVAGEMRDANSKEGKRAVRSLQSRYRENNEASATDAVDRARHYGGSELRTGMDTTSASGGSFVTPQYFVDDYAAFHQFGRVFADAANKQELPDYGMTIFIPSVSTAAGVGAQPSQNSGITETDPTAGYLSVGLTTNAGQVTVSQQLLDRAGPNFQFDKMVFDQLLRAYNLTLDQYVLTQALANAGVITASTAALTGTGGIFPLLGKAKAAIVDASGVVLPATHAFFQPVNFEWMASQTSTDGHTLWTPNYAGPFNAVAGGSDGTPIAEGATGYKISGLPVYEDGNIPLVSTNNQAIVAHMPEVWFWEGDLVNRTIPQTVAQNLSVLLQAYAYVGAIVRYPKAVQALQGAAFPTSPTF